MSKLLEKLLATLINLAGPAIIKLILDWLKGLSEDETKEVAEVVAKSIKKVVDSDTTNA